MSNQPVTITDPNMTRFLMTLEEAVGLVEYTYVNGNNGDIFVQKSPSATIGDLAKAVLLLFEANNPIKIIGTRHGEKLYETLLTKEEMLVSKDLGKYYKIPADTRDLNYDKYFVEGDTRIQEQKDYNSHNSAQLNINEIIEKLKSIKYVQEKLDEWKKQK